MIMLQSELKKIVQKKLKMNRNKAMSRVKLRDKYFIIRSNFILEENVQNIHFDFDFKTFTDAEWLWIL